MFTLFTIPLCISFPFSHHLLLVSLKSHQWCLIQEGNLALRSGTLWETAASLVGNRAKMDLNQMFRYHRVFFLLVPPRKVLSMELVPPNRDKWLRAPKMAKIPAKKVKVQVRVCHTFTFCCTLAEKSEGLTDSDLDFHFFSWDIAIFGEFSNFFTIGWDQFHT